MLRVLHTADWHLGKKLEQCDRTAEHQFFLDWLLGILTTECVDVLLIAGDLFDSGDPPNTAFEQYYGFLRRVKDTCCREVVIIGGNHDSISTLNAPKALLKYFNVHIVGGVPADFKEQVIPILNTAGETALVICAVPFLRDKDIRLSITGETVAERENRIRQGIYQHYDRFRELILPYKAEGIPVIATGHLFAAGSATSESEKEIHVGNLGQVSGELLPAEFDYIALGHIHRPQLVSKQAHIRYSGSPIPLSFSETADQKQVLLLEFEKGKPLQIKELEVPACRRLLRLKGDIESIQKKLEGLQDTALALPAWVELQVETEGFVPSLEEDMHTLIAKKPFIEKLFIRQNRKRRPEETTSPVTESASLADLNPTSVFLQKLAQEYPETAQPELIKTFEEAMELYSQQEKN